MSTFFFQICFHISPIAFEPINLYWWNAATRSVACICNPSIFTSYENEWARFSIKLTCLMVPGPILWRLTDLYNSSLFNCTFSSIFCTLTQQLCVEHNYKATLSFKSFFKNKLLSNQKVRLSWRTKSVGSLQIVNIRYDCNLVAHSCDGLTNWQQYAYWLSSVTFDAMAKRVYNFWLWKNIETID